MQNYRIGPYLGELLRISRYVLWTRKNADYVLLFFVAASLRVLSELNTGIYPTGFDTTSGYIILIQSPIRINFAWLFNGPLIPTLLTLCQIITGINPFLELKILAPLFYGTFALSFCYMVKRWLGWSNKVAALVSLVFSMEPDILRLGWDLLRQEIALVFLFLLIGVTKGDLFHASKRKIVLILTILIVMTEQLGVDPYF